MDKTSLRKWGNSQGAIIPKKIIDELELEEKQEFEIHIEDGNIIFVPTKNEPTTLAELFKDWEDDGIRITEIDWGEPQGSEHQW